jgi:hypothetical protein
MTITKFVSKSVSVLDISEHPLVIKTFGQPQESDISFHIEAQMSGLAVSPCYAVQLEGQYMLLNNLLPLRARQFICNQRELAEEFSRHNEVVPSMMDVLVVDIKYFSPEKIQDLIVEIGSEPCKVWSQLVEIGAYRHDKETKLAEIRTRSSKLINQNVPEGCSKFERFQIMESIRQQLEYNSLEFWTAHESNGTAVEITAKFLKWGKSKLQQSLKIREALMNGYTASPASWRSDPLVIDLDAEYISVNAVYKMITKKVEESESEDNTDDKNTDANNANGSGEGNGVNGDNEPSGNDPADDSEDTSSEAEVDPETARRQELLDDLRTSPITGHVIDFLNDAFFLSDDASPKEWSDMARIAKLIMEEAERRMGSV